MSTYTNKWLSTTCPSVNEFKVDTTKTEYYIQYFETKSKVASLNSGWINIKKTTEELKGNIEELKSAIDSEDYKAKTNDLVVALDESITALDNNFTKLFNSVVHRMEEAAASDDWFSEAASLYASYITTAILGNKYVKSNSINATLPNETGSAQAEQYSLASEAPSEGGSQGASPAASSGGRSGATPRSVGAVPDDGSTDVPDNASSASNATPATSADTPSTQDSELTATNVQYSATPSNGIDVSKYTSKPERGFVVTTDNPKYNLSSSDIELLTAIVSAESDKSYDDALAVASTIFNRCEEPKWASCGGSNPVKQATAPNQFVVYQHGSYKQYMGSGAPDTCRQAVLDVMNGARNHDYLSFRSNGSSNYGGNMITSTGNRYK